MIDTSYPQNDPRRTKHCGKDNRKEQNVSNETAHKWASHVPSVEKSLLRGALILQWRGVLDSIPIQRHRPHFRVDLNTNTLFALFAGASVADGVVFEDQVVGLAHNSDAGDFFAC